MTSIILCLLLTIIPFLYPQTVQAHAFGKLYNLPVPFWLYLYGGAATIIVSFFVIGYFFKQSKAELTYPSIKLSRFTIFKILTQEQFLISVQIVSMFLFFLTIISGIIGIDSAYANFNMTFFWIIFVLGLTYTSAIFGNIYSILNPRKAIIEIFEKTFNLSTSRLLPYPKKLAYWPAFIFYFIFIWIELMGQTTPFTLSIILIQYSIITVLGVLAFGKEAYFKYIEFFSVFFKLISKISVFEMKSGKLFLRPPFIGLLKEKVEHFSLLLFILFMLSSTAFDGFRETTPWFRLYWQNFDSVLRPIFGDQSYNLFQTFGLILSPFIFWLIFLILSYLTKLITKIKTPVTELMLQFGFSLIPIAFVYNFAHYFTLLLTQGQEIIRLISDPFGNGWNLFGTAEYTSNLTVVDANITWHTQVAIILLGHVVGVYLAHVIALRIFPTHKRALISQIPMLILMVSYTMIGLWILSQPITSGI